MLKHTRLEKLAMDKHSSMLGPFEVKKKMKSCEYDSRGILATLYFLMNGNNKLECFALKILLQPSLTLIPNYLGKLRPNWQTLD